MVVVVRQGSPRHWTSCSRALRSAMPGRSKAAEPTVVDQNRRWVRSDRPRSPQPRPARGKESGPGPRLRPASSLSTTAGTARAMVPGTRPPDPQGLLRAWARLADRISLDRRGIHSTGLHRHVGLHDRAVKPVSMPATVVRRSERAPRREQHARRASSISPWNIARHDAGDPRRPTHSIELARSVRPGVVVDVATEETPGSRRTCTPRRIRRTCSETSCVRPQARAMGVSSSRRHGWSSKSRRRTACRRSTRGLRRGGPSPATTGGPVAKFGVSTARRSRGFVLRVARHVHVRSAPGGVHGARRAGRAAVSGVARVVEVARLALLGGSSRAAGSACSHFAS